MRIDSKFYAKRDMSPSPTCRFIGCFHHQRQSIYAAVGALNATHGGNSPLAARVGAVWRRRRWCSPQQAQFSRHGCVGGCYTTSPSPSPARPLDKRASRGHAGSGFLKTVDDFQQRTRGIVVSVAGRECTLDAQAAQVALALFAGGGGIGATLLGESQRPRPQAVKRGRRRHRRKRMPMPATRIPRAHLRHRHRRQGGCVHRINGSA